jgi:uncharacterized protein
MIPLLLNDKEDEVYEKIKAKYNGFDKYDKKEFQQVFKRIQELKKRYNIFSSSRPKERGVIPPLDIDMIKQSYAQHGTQQLALEITQQCNLRCKYCVYSGKYYYYRAHRSNSMNLDIAKRSIDFYLERYKIGGIDTPPVVGFYGGEPLLCTETIKNCLIHLNHLKRNGYFHKIRARICTNGTLLNPENIDFFIENDVVLQISIDGPRNHHDKNRVFENGSGTFDILMNKLETIYKKSPSYYKDRVVFVCTVTPGADMVKLNDFFLNNPLMKENLITIGSVDKKDNTYLSDCEINLNQEKEFMYLKNVFMQNRILEKGKKATFLDREIDRAFVALYKRPIIYSKFDLFGINGPCQPGIRKLYVSANGTFHPCEKMNPSFPIGDIFNGYDYVKILKMWNDFIELMNKEECLHCWANRFCTNCFVTVAKDGYFEITKRRLFCKVTKSNTLKNLKEFSLLLEKNPKIADEWDNTMVM